MQSLGKVVAILNEDLVLFTSTEDLNKYERVEVYAIISDPRLEQAQLNELHIPLGTLQVIAPQPNNVYLAERFRNMERRTRKEVTNPPNWLTITSMMPVTREIVDEIPGKWSAELSHMNSLGINLPQVIEVGQHVRRAF